MSTSQSLHGSCHCGRLQLDFRSALAASVLQPRACDCSFCRKHGAAWVSDPDGELCITELDADALGEYRQGAELARFLLCRNCGVLVAVMFEQEAVRYAAVNAGCLDPGAILGATAPVSPQRLAPEEKTARWKKLWMTRVELRTLED